jgi:hypothetical protein
MKKQLIAKNNNIGHAGWRRGCVICTPQIYQLAAVVNNEANWPKYRPHNSQKVKKLN